MTAFSLRVTAMVPLTGRKERCTVGFMHDCFFFVYGCYAPFVQHKRKKRAVNSGIYASVFPLCIIIAVVPLSGRAE